MWFISKLVENGNNQCVDLSTIIYINKEDLSLSSKTYTYGIILNVKKEFTDNNRRRITISYDKKYNRDIEFKILTKMLETYNKFKYNIDSFEIDSSNNSITNLPLQSSSASEEQE